MSLHLAKLISSSVEQTLEDRVAIAFSGGVDSTTIAAIAAKHANVELFAAGTSGSEDLEYAEKVAASLGLPLQKVMLDQEGILDAYAQCHAMLPLDLLKLEILVPVYRVAEAASVKGHKVLLFGSGAEELFVGYERYYNYRADGKDLDSLLREEFRTLPQRDIGWVKKVCRKFGVEARFPFYVPELARFMFSVPLEERMDGRELKKGILREAAKLLGAPELAVRRKKKAMQYGSGVHKILMNHSERINRDFVVLQPQSRC
jgi:asparagine synthase (glutamine-hydrolysing)